MHCEDNVNGGFKCNGGNLLASVVVLCRGIHDLHKKDIGTDDILSCHGWKYCECLTT